MNARHKRILRKRWKIVRTKARRDVGLEYERGCEHLAETKAQHYSETALCGDSWPGAMLDIDRIAQAVDDIEKQLRWLGGFPRKKAYTGKVRPVEIDPNDIPF